MSCPSCLILFACYHYLVSSCFSFPISEGVSLWSCPRYVFLVFFFVSFSGDMFLLDLSPRSSRPVVSSSRLVVRLGRGGRVRHVLA